MALVRDDFIDLSLVLFIKSGVWSGVSVVASYETGMCSYEMMPTPLNETPRGL